MKILLLGGGGREHALALALAQDNAVREIHVAPGNPGIAAIATLHDIVPTDSRAVLHLAERLKIDLVIVGPEAPLVAGIADVVRASGIACFGPDKAAAMIEGSKEFAKEIMAKAAVPTASFRSCENESEIREACHEFGPPYVVKHDGLASGKGVIVTNEIEEAIKHGALASRVIVEEFLAGHEFSLFGISDGVRVIAMEPAQDFKRVGENDTGANTGGMGAYSPLPWISNDDKEFVLTKVLQPVIDQLRIEGRPFIGVLFAGLIKTNSGIKVIEFNARFGDPETQVLLSRLTTPLGGLLKRAALGSLSENEELSWSTDSSVAVVIASKGYPENPQLGEPITLPESKRDKYVLHAGTSSKDGELFSSGGRVLNAVGVGEDITQARARAYEIAAQVQIPGSFYRRDIASQMSK